jgi:hypothetical protein
MSKKERASLGFTDELEDFNPVAWSKLDAHSKPKPVDTKNAAEAAGFRSREPTSVVAPEPALRLRRRRTGRNVQFNIKTKAETIAAFCALADAKGWGIGETFEMATDLLTREYNEDIR